MRIQLNTPGTRRIGRGFVLTALIGALLLYAYRLVTLAINSKRSNEADITLGAIEQVEDRLTRLDERSCQDQRANRAALERLERSLSGLHRQIREHRDSEGEDTTMPLIVERLDAIEEILGKRRFSFGALAVWVLIFTAGAFLVSNYFQARQPQTSAPVHAAAAVEDVQHDWQEGWLKNQVSVVRFVAQPKIDLQPGHRLVYSVRDQADKHIFDYRLPIESFSFSRVWYAAPIPQILEYRVYLLDADDNQVWVSEWIPFTIEARADAGKNNDD